MLEPGRKKKRVGRETEEKGKGCEGKGQERLGLTFHSNDTLPSDHRHWLVDLPSRLSGEKSFLILHQ